MTYIAGIGGMCLGGFIVLLLWGLCAVAAPTTTVLMQDRREFEVELSTTRARIRTALAMLHDGQVGDAAYVLERAIGEGE